MVNRAIYRTIILIIATNFILAHAGENSYYNRAFKLMPTEVIQSAYIQKGFEIEYSFPDYGTLSTIRLTYGFENLLAFHLGLGLFDANIGFSLNLLSFLRTEPLIAKIMIGDGFPYGIHGTISFIYSLYYDENYEAGISAAYGMEMPLPIELDGTIYYEYQRNENRHFKEDIYYFYKVNKKFAVGVGLGLTQLKFAYDPENFGYCSKYQFGAALKYHF